MPQQQVAIIGAGPIGLELAVALKRAGVDYVHFEAGQIGQTVSWYPKMTRFFSSSDRIAIAGMPLQTADQSKATREEYLAYLRNIVLHFELEVRTYERVMSVGREGDSFLIETNRSGGGTACRVDRIVLAVGDMARPHLLHIPGEDLEHVSHYFDDAHRYFGQKLLIVGGKNSAVEAAIRCSRAGADVTISYRQAEFDPNRIKYWLLPELAGMIKSGKVRFLPQTVPVSIAPGRVTLRPAAGVLGDPVEVDADFVLLLTGYCMDDTLFKMLGVELAGENQAPVFDPVTMQTNVPGVYVAGTAAAGTQTVFRLFIENCHVHVPRIVASVSDQAPPDEAGMAARDESQLET